MKVRPRHGAGEIVGRVYAPLMVAEEFGVSSFNPRGLDRARIRA